MGAAASTMSLDSISAEDIGKLVASIGEAYKQYESLIVQNGISGEVVASMDPAGLKELLSSAGITNAVHQTVLLANFKKLQGGSTAVGHHHAHAPNDPNCCQFHALPSDFLVKEKIEKTPRFIMTKLFEIQGIGVDPTDLDPAVDKIAKAVGVGFGDGVSKYDCFINYRVAADADLAEKIYLYLRDRKIYAFLDKKCLKNGEKWKDGFLTGLKNSKCFLSLISRKALDRVRDKGSDHTYDNVLLEYETALNIMQTTNNAKFICPLHVGECNGGNLSKFIDFNPSLYPDSVVAIPDAAAPKAEATPAAPGPTSSIKASTTIVAKSAPAPPSAPAKDDQGESNADTDDQITCQVCCEGLTKYPAGTWGDGWSCDWPGHEGNNWFSADEPVYGCPTIIECNWGVCQTCWDAYHEKKKEEQNQDDTYVIAQPAGTKSAYNNEYYCEVKSLRFEVAPDESCKLVVEYNVRGDMSLGPLQNPMRSRIIVGDLTLSPSDIKVYFKDAYQNRGELIYALTEDDAEQFANHKVKFVFGEEGYSAAILVMPSSTVRDVELPTCNNDHVLTISDCQDGDYMYGFVCNCCGRGKNGLRWFCPQCYYDVCFSCEPLRVMYPLCSNEHEMQRFVESNMSHSCDNCSRQELQNDPEFYRCAEDNYDLCLICSSEQQKAINEAAADAEQE